VTVVNASTNLYCPEDTTRQGTGPTMASRSEYSCPLETHRKTTHTFTLYSSNLSPNWAESGAFLLYLNKQIWRLDVFRKGLGCAMVPLRLGRWPVAVATCHNLPLGAGAVLLKGSAESCFGTTLSATGTTLTTDRFQR
jgi:hypothetical protein